MYSILIECSTKEGIVAINKNEKNVLYHNFYDKEDLSFIFLLIEKFLKKLNISLKDISFISCGQGPGLFTSLRASFSIVKALCYALEIDQLGFCSLKSFIPQKNGNFVIITDAKSEKVYVLEAEKDGNNTVFSNHKIVPLKQAVEEYKNNLIVTPELDLFSSHFTNIEKVSINRDFLAKLCFEKFQKKGFSSQIIYSKKIF